MPYTEPKTRVYFDEHPNEAKEPGDLTYVIYKPIYKMWKDEPRFRTWFVLAKGQRDIRLIPKPILELMTSLSKGGALTPDIFAAFDCALLELWTRHVSKYEEEKMAVNGDVQV